MKKEAFVTKEQIEEIVKTYPTPFHIYDEKGIRENVKALKEAFSWNKGFKEYFAVKATPNPFLINILRDYGCGCDCSSLTELMLSDAMGVSGEDIMFSSNDTPAEEFTYAAKLGATINLDDITHIAFLEKTIGRLPETLPAVIIRAACSKSARTLWIIRATRSTALRQSSFLRAFGF